MRSRFIGTAMVAGALMVAGADVVAAQGMPVRKDRAERPRVDTVVVTRVDTVYQRDTLAAVGVAVRVDTVFVNRVRVDTLRIREEAGALPPGMNFYWGFGGGALVPGDDIGDFYNPSWNVMALLGWRSNMSPWGLRLEGAYNNLSADDDAFGETGFTDPEDANIWSATANVTAAFPYGPDRPASFYLLGGGGVFGVDVGASSETEFGANAGAGIRFGVGGANLFLEGKWVKVFTQPEDITYYPITLGFTF